jgi:hypothetical protein
MKWSEKNITQWEQVRSKGRDHFIWYRGVLGWGVPFAITMIVWQWYRKGWDELYFSGLFYLIFGPVGGYFWGAWMWKWLEKKYAEHSSAA